MNGISHFRRTLAVTALSAAALAAGCSQRLTPARAGTIIRHSKAFLSGSVESHPVFDRVTALRTPDAAKGDEGDSCIAEFSYHWPAGSNSAGIGVPAPQTGRVYLRKSGEAWAVDDERSRTLIPSWPQLPAGSRPFGLGAPP